MSVPEARVTIRPLNFTMSSRETQIHRETIGPDTYVTSTVLKFPVTVEGGAVAYDFHALRFRYAERGDGTCVLSVESDDTGQDKEVWVGGIKMAEGRNLGSRMFVKPLGRAPMRYVGEGQVPVAQAVYPPRVDSVQLPPLAPPRAGKIRILYVSGCTLVGGQETVLKRLLRSIDKDCYEVECLITHDRGPLHDEYARHAKMEYVPPGDSERAGTYILNKAKAGGYDYIHFFNLWSAYDVIPSLRETCPATRIIVTLLADFYGHRESWKPSINMVRYVRPHLSGFTTDSYMNRRVFPDITVIRNGIPVETFSPGVKDPKLWAWVGRVINEKRPDRFVELAKRLPDHKFVMAGDGFPDVIERIKKNAPPNLEVRPGMSERGVADLLAEAQYLVFTSMTEGLPLTVLEGMAAGCMVVAEQVGDIPSVITDGQTGYLVPAGKVDTAEWITNVISKFDPKVGAEARRTIIGEYSEDGMVKRYEHLYGRVGSHGGQTRVAFLWGVLPHHGIGYWDTKTDSHQFAISQLDRCNVVRVYAPTGGAPERKILNGQDMAFYSSPADLLEQLRDFAPDMIFMNMIQEARWPLVARSFPGTWKALVHFGDANLRVPWAREVNLFIMQQEFMTERVLEVNNLPRSHAKTVTFGVEQWAFKPLPREKTYTGIMVADFRKEVKRQHLLIEAWKDIPGQLVLVGPYERSIPHGFHDECKNLARSLGMEERIIFIDGYPHADLPELINKAKVGFLTSSHEGGSRALLEMMACGLPCVVLSDCEGNTQMIRGGVDGVITLPSPESIAEKANWLLENDRYVAMGKAASERVRRDYPFHSMSDKYADIVGEARPEVSVITTSMNRGRFLEECVKSVLAQGGAKINHLIMDGGSSDQTPEILEKYRGRVHGYVDRGLGQTGAILRGLQNIEDQFPQTRYVGWINADDFYSSGWLQDSLAVLRDAPPDVAMVCGDAVQVYENGSPRQPLNYVQTPYVTMDQLCQRGNIIIQPTVLIRLDALRAIRQKTGMTWNPTYHYTQDLELWIRFMRNGYKVAKVGKVTAYLRSHPGQMSIEHMDDQIIERDRLLRPLSVDLGLPNPGWVRG